MSDQIDDAIGTKPVSEETELRNDVRTAMPLHGLNPELESLVEASGAFVRGCWEAAKGVLVLANVNEYGGHHCRRASSLGDVERA